MVSKVVLGRQRGARFRRGAPNQTVCAKAGYADLAFFRRLFKRHTGMTPAEYRRRFAPMSVRREEGGESTPAM